MPGNAFSGIQFSKIFRGSMPPDPPRSDGLQPIVWVLRTHNRLRETLKKTLKLTFLPYLPNSPLLPTFMGPLHCFVLCFVGDCGKIVIFAIFAKFATFVNFYGPPSLLCVLPRWRLWQNCYCCQYVNSTTFIIF